MPIPKMVRSLSWPTLLALAACLHRPQMVGVSPERGFQRAECYSTKAGFVVLDSAARAVRESAPSRVTWRAQLFISLHGDSALATPLDWKWIGRDSAVADYGDIGYRTTWNLRRDGRFLRGTASQGNSAEGNCDDLYGSCKPVDRYNTHFAVESQPLQLTSIPCSFLVTASAAE